jgi:hypothetical protein
VKKQELNFECLKLIYDAINRPFNPGKVKLEGRRDRDKISEIRIEEVHDSEETRVFWRIYYTVNEQKIILGESEINPQLARYKSNYL